ncbi:decapping and exoribonuclease protein-like [Macrosteles quadrilineatus]|uniref:decapping and exoribonuclease protein-like n=1 Tax=Macrosteles quadrilineatus TaxID=74068 RepID=UPI0023E2EF0A|nr:decapping and exoribonuclease protein-like [Macrosteles quadrilineatus]
MNTKRKFDNRNSSGRNYNNFNVKTNSNYLTLNYDDNTVQCKRTEIIRDGRKFPVFQKPSVIGVFSVDTNRKFLPNESQLKYLFWCKSPQGGLASKVNFNLNEGIEKCVRKDELLNEKLDHIFTWIQAEGNQKEEFQTADFVCFRGLLTTIMCTPYEQQEGWIICATRLKNTNFLCAFDTEKRKREKENVSDRLKQFQSWGYKFEQFMLAEEPGQEPDTSQPVLETEELCCIFRSKLSGNSLVYAAEMDGVCSDEPVDAAGLRSMKAPFIELKTSRHIETQRQDTSFKRYKLLKWWCQSFLVGIETIYCGFRDDDGIVSTVKEYKVREIPKMAKGFWDPCVCMNFCAQFLDFVKRCINESSRPNALWKFEWNPGNSITGKEINGQSEFSFVPDWYLKSES